MLDESGQVTWFADLQRFWSSSSQGSSTRATRVCGKDHGSLVLPPPPVPALEWAVDLSSSAVRYEPGDTRLSAAVLTAASITWQSSVACAEVRRLALHVAAETSASSSSRRGASRILSPGRRSSGGLARAAPAADVAGFNQVATEAGVTIRMLQPGQLDGQPAAAAREFVITNSGLNIMLSRHTFVQLRQLVQHLQDSRKTGRATDSPRSSSARNLQPPPPLGKPVGSQSSGQQQGPAFNVMTGVLQSAYSTPAGPVEHPREASVFLDGKLEGAFRGRACGAPCAQ